MMTRRRWSCIPRVIVAAAIALSFALNVLPSEAGWLKGLSSIASKGGAAKAGKLGIGLVALESAAAHLARIPSTGKLVPLAAHATPEGHWSFVNKNGDVFTAANADEMARLGPTLAPTLEADGKLAFYISEETALKTSTHIDALPKAADLHVVAGDASYPLIRKPAVDATAATFTAQVRPNVLVELTPHGDLSEALAMLSRPLNKANVRMLSLEAGGPKQLPSVASFDKADKTTLVDRLDPTALPAAFAKVRGQTVLVTGVVDGDALHVLPTGAISDAVSIARLREAAAASDVNLVVLQQSSARQPGGRNWLWQKVKVSGLDDAVQQTQFADFLNVLGDARGQLQVSATADGYGRTLLQAVPVSTSSGALRTTFGPWAGEVADELRGSITVHGLQAFLRDSAREKELDARFIPGIPSWVQILALVNLIFGLIAYEVSWRWWSKVWPPEERTSYSSRFGYFAARFARLVFYVFVFLPLVGGIAFLRHLMMQIWFALTAPLRFGRWIKGKFAGA